MVETLLTTQGYPWKPWPNATEYYFLRHRGKYFSFNRSSITANWQYGFWHSRPEGAQPFSYREDAESAASYFYETGSVMELVRLKREGRDIGSYTEISTEPLAVEERKFFDPEKW